MLNKIRSSGLHWLLFSAAAAVLCAAAHAVQRATAFEGQLELPIPFAPATVILVLLLLLSAAGLLFLGQRELTPRIFRRAPEKALASAGSALYTGAMVTAAFLSLIAAPFFLRTGRRLWLDFRNYQSITGHAPAGGNNGLITLLAGLFALLAFLGLGRTALRVHSGKPTKGRALLLPVITNCLWLMDFYRTHAANPVRWDYAPLLLAIAAGILFWLDWSGLYAGVPIPCRTLITAGLTAVLSLTALAGSWDMSSALLLTAQLIGALSVLWLMPRNLNQPPEEPAPAPVTEPELNYEYHPVSEPAPSEEKLEEEPHE